MATIGDSSRAEGLLDDLEGAIDAVDMTLQPLLEKALSATTSKLPVLDKAKLYIHTAYGIESLLFSYLKLNNVDAKEHPIFAELSRVKAYFAKVKVAEDAGPSARLDKAAANRFIKSALSGNDEYDRRRAEAKKQQEAGAKRKLDALEDRYSTSARFEVASNKIKENEANGEQNENTDGKAAAEAPSGEDVNTASKKAKKKNKKRRSEEAKVDGTGEQAEEHQTSFTDVAMGKKNKKKKLSHAPKDHHQAFQSLLNKSSSKDLSQHPSNSGPSETKVTKKNKKSGKSDS